MAQWVGFDGAPPLDFYCVTNEYFYIFDILPFLERLWFAVQFEKYIMGCNAVGGPVMSSSMTILATILDFTPPKRNYQRELKKEKFVARHV